MEYQAQDKTGKNVRINWKKTNILSPELASFKREVSGLASLA